MADNRPLHRKYKVERTDGDPMDRHTDCDYFVLDLTHDPDARIAALAYADACNETRPRLAYDLRRKVGEAIEEPTDG